MEKKIRLMKLTSLTVLFASLGIALFLSNMPAFLRWACVAVFAVGIVLLFLGRHKLQSTDEREMYIEHVAGWIAGVLTLTLVSVFIISDVLRHGHYDERLFTLISVWAVSKVLVVIAMGGGRGKVA